MSARTLHHLLCSSWVLIGLAVAGCAPGWGGCVSRGTLIATPTCPRPVETLRVGDPVVSRDPDRKHGVATVVDVRSTIADEVLVLHVSSGRELTVTRDHPIWADGQWTRAGALRPGQSVETKQGAARVAQITSRCQRTRVFDLTVAPHANFYANGVLVHNKTIVPQPTIDSTVGAWVGLVENRLYLLELTKDGHGRAAMLWGRQIQLFRVDRWCLNRYKIELELSALPDGGPRRRFRGEFEGPDRFCLRTVSLGVTSPRSRSGWFSRPEDLSEGIEALRQALAGEGTRGEEHN
jgi:hypothetical protein